MNELSDGRFGAAAIELGSSALRLFSAALLVARGEEVDVARLETATAFHKLKTLIEARDLPHPPPDFADTETLISNQDALSADALPPAEVMRVTESLQRTLRWLRGRIEPRTLGELKRDKRLRLGAFTLALLTLLITSIVWLVKPQSLAHGKPVLVSSNHPNSTAPAGGLTDGNTKDGYGVHTNLEQHPWVSVDLGQSHAIDRVKIYNRGDGWFNDALPLKLEFSEDGKRFDLVQERTKPFTQAAPWVYRAEGKKARYVRISGRSGGFVALSELEVF
ncbi:MAG TPA: discoidin domain-containing protein [Polyangiaceae bacterium]